jgi:hypothetical protein
MEIVNGAHTPGPWRTGGSEIFADNNLRVASVWSYPGADTEADAHLIAAAPELLAALESAVRELENEFGTDNPRARQFDTAIAKAKGRA